MFTLSEKKPSNIQYIIRYNPTHLPDFEIEKV